MNQSLQNLYSLFNPSKNNGLNGSSEYTHVSMGNKTGQYYLSSSNDHQFYQIYNSILSSNIPVCLAEKQGDYVPLIGDIDIKIDNIDDNSANFKEIRTLYSNEELLGTIKCFQEAIKKNIIVFSDKVNEDDNYSNYPKKILTCVVLEKKPYKSGNFLKNGFHLHFPYLFVDKNKVKNILIPQIKENVSKYKLGNGKNLFSNHTENPENFVDDVTSKCWLMYGSSKSEELKPYKLTEIYNYDLCQIQPLEAFTMGDFFNREEKKLIIDNSNVNFLLPQLLSVSSIKKEIFNVKTPLELKIPTKVYLKQKLKDIENDSESIRKNLIQAKNLLRILKPSRADNYNSWWDIGIILFNIGHGCEEAFKLWDKWSRNSDNYDEDACLEIWDKMEKRDPVYSQTKGMGSLRWYAKQDNLIKYNEFVEGCHGILLDKNNLLKSVISANIMTTDAPLAKLLFDMFSDKYIFSDNGWYSFNGTIWTPVKNQLKEFRNKLEYISVKYEEFKKTIFSLLYHENSDSGKESDSDDSEKEDEKLDKKNRALLIAKKQEIFRAKNKLENFTSQNGILNYCQVLFYNEEFSELLDENPLIIAFKNGVFDFETLTFRQGLQSDYISKTLNIKYEDSLTVDSKEVKELQDFLHKIFPDESVRQYFIDQTCEVFRGGNRDKIAMFWTGNGNNGKSVTQRLFETMIGKKLAIKLSTSVLTERIQPGQPNPQLTRLRGGVRWGVFDEWGKTEQILSGSLNVLTGGDSLPCRDLFQKGSDSNDFTPMFKILCICNELPCLKDAVDATWDRIRIIPFESKFVSREKCPSTIEEQKEKKIFLCDTEITQKDRMNSLAKALGWYLIQTFIKKEKSRLKGSYEPFIPDKVNDAKIKYQTKCDILAYFMEDTYIKTNNNDHKITFDDMYVSFKGWYMNSFSGKMITLNKHEFIEMVKNKYNLGETDKFIKGFTWNHNYDEEED